MPAKFDDLVRRPLSHGGAARLCGWRLVVVLMGVGWLGGVVGAAEPQADAPVEAAPLGQLSPVIGARTSGIDAWLPPEQLLWLDAGEERFATRWLPSLSGRTKGIALILPDAGQHASWPFTVAALFEELPLHGWHTLALPLPAPAALVVSLSVAPPPEAPEASEAVPSAIPPEAAESEAPSPAATAAAAPPITEQASGPETIEARARARIERALAYALQQHEDLPVVLIGFGTGAARAIAFTLSNTETSNPVQAALVLVEPPPLMPGGASLAGLLAQTAPAVLDVTFGSNAIEKRQAELRRRATLAQTERRHTQLTLTPLTATDPAATNTLAKRIRGWLARHASKP